MGLQRPKRAGGHTKILCGEAVGVSPYPRLSGILATIVSVAVNHSQHDAMTNTEQ